MFKKISIVCLATLLSCGVAFAGGVDSVNLDNTVGPIVDTSSKAVGNIIPLYGGFSSGAAIGGGAASLDAGGYVIFGKASIDDSTTNGAAGFASSESYKTGGGLFNPNATVGTNAWAAGAANSTLDVTAKGLAGAAGGFVGIAGQASGAQATMGNAPFLNATQGHTDIQGAQFGAGGYVGGAGAALFGKGHASANLWIAGDSNVMSGRYGSFVDGGVQEGLYSMGSVSTEVESSASAGGKKLGTGFVKGAFIAGGVLTMDAHQTGVFQPATADAVASGAYSGSGQIGQNYTGIATGAVETRITQTENGATSQSWGSMSVTSHN